MKPIWDGTGSAEECAWWCLRNGLIVGRPYIIRRMRSYLAKEWSYLPKAERRERIRYTIERSAGNDDWMRSRNECLVESLCRDAVRWWWTSADASIEAHR